MSFGFSVGDFIAVGSIIADIISSLREVGGSKSEYQEILRELEGLQHALSHLDKLQSSDGSTSIDSIKYAALSCRRPLEQFLGKIKKYDNTLGVWGKAGTLKSAGDKLKWTYTQKDEIRKLQTYLNVHVGTINILLAKHSLEKMDIVSEKNEQDQLQVRNRLENTRKNIELINSSTQSQARAMVVTNSMLGKLFQMVSGEVIASLKLLAEMVTKVCVSTQKIYTVVLEIKNVVGPGDTRWTYFQAPLIVEDALGFKFPVPSEYDHVLLDTIIKHRFLEGPGSLDVTLGNYELFHARDSSQLISPQVRLLPGTSITMAIIVGRSELSDQECPMPRCKSNQTTVAPGGGRICCQCNVFFDKSSKKRRSLQDLLDGISQQSNEARPGKRKSDSDHDARKRLKLSSGDENMYSFRNVRWTMECIPLEDTGNSTDQFEAPIVVTNNVDFEHSVEQSGSGKRVGTPIYLPSTHSGTEPLLRNALDYLDLVKVEFQEDQPETYDLFLDVMASFKQRTLDTPGVINHVTYLFEGREALLQGFNSFLPPGYRILPDARCDPNFVFVVGKRMFVKPVDDSVGDEFDDDGEGEGIEDESDDLEFEDVGDFEGDGATLY